MQVVYRAFETATRDPNVFKTQQVAALAAGQQQKFWNFAELFYHEQGDETTSYVTTSYLDGLAGQVDDGIGGSENFGQRGIAGSARNRRRGMTRFGQPLPEPGTNQTARARDRNVHLDILSPISP